MSITESTLIVGADIAKETHEARAIDFQGIELGKRCVFSNDHKGLIKLVAWMKDLQRVHDKLNILFGIEPTGHYWFPLAEYLKKKGIQVVVVNPLHVDKSKEVEDNSPTKNGLKDAKVIAKLLKDGSYTEPHLPTWIYADLRTAMNLREKVMVNWNQVKMRIQNWLDRFSRNIVKYLKTGKAKLLYTKQMEKIMKHVEELVSQVPGAQEMLTLPGLGFVTLAGFLAEVGDLNGYRHGQQIIRLAGLNLKENSFGKHKGKSTISKRGRKRLRALLFRCMLPAKNQEFKALHQYYTTRNQIRLRRNNRSLRYVENSYVSYRR